MKISYRWLQDYVECADVPIEKIADLLTMAGLEVEGVQEQRVSFPDGVVVGEILELQQHPNSSDLYVCQVQAGQEKTLTIVCGAPNTTAGIKVAVALPGTLLPNGFPVQTASIRGILSDGMICAEDELGISDDHTGIIVFPEETPIGQPLSGALFKLEDDIVLEIGLTPNRGDCLSHFGVARELATLLNRPLRKPPIDYPEDGEDIHRLAAVFIKNSDLCYRYAGSVITDVKIGPSPQWLRRRLENIGIRSINNIVDVTNFVMAELGQPLHAFDLAKLNKQKIVVRQAADGETFTTLDGVERPLDDQMLMIADGERSVAIAGVMGGLNSEVSDTTTTILIESAYFSPSSIRKTSKKLGLSTEASYRFERGIDLLGVDYALRRATKLMAELGRGTVARGILDVFPHPYSPLKLSLRIAQVEKILGMTVPVERIHTIFTQLGFGMLAEHGSTTSQHVVEIEVPSYRPDVTREIDLIEEIARIYGYDNIPVTLPAGEIPPKMESTARTIEEMIRSILISQGMCEVVNYSFFDQHILEHLAVTQQEPYNNLVLLRNPLNAEQGVLRTTMLPGLLRNVVVNRSTRVENIRLFEIGRVFYNTNVSEPLPDEKTLVSGIIAGSKMDKSWAYPQEPVDFYDLKGIVEIILHRVHVPYEFRRITDVAFLHPGESATIHIDHECLGFIGKVHPDVLERFQIEEEQVYLFEIALAPLVTYGALYQTFRSLPRFPAVHRDLALVVPAQVQAADIEAVIGEVGKPLLENLTLFDHYVGPQITAGCVGLTYALTYRSLEKTLIDDEVTEIHQQIVEQLHTRLNVALRQ